MNSAAALGIFDSGVGGLTVVHEVRKLLPHEDIVYFGDTARVPYGPKSHETIARFCTENILLLLRFSVKMIIIACNTASSVALAAAQNQFRVPLLGVIEPGARAAARATRSKRIGIIGTRTTIASTTYETAIRRYLPEAVLFAVSCPLFVPLVEEGMVTHPVTAQMAADYLLPLRQEGIDTLVLGCTHYPLLKPVISAIMGQSVQLVDSAQQVAAEARDVLIQEKLLNSQGVPGTLRCLVSDEPKSFERAGGCFLGMPLTQVEKVSYV